MSSLFDIESSLSDLTASQALGRVIEAIYHNSSNTPQDILPLIQLGLARAQSNLLQVEEDLRSSSESFSGDWNEVDLEQVKKVLNEKGDEEILRKAVILEDLRRRLETCCLIYPTYTQVEDPMDNEEKASVAINDQDEGMDIEDPWAEPGDEKDVQEDVVVDDPWETGSSLSLERDKPSRLPERSESMEDIPGLPNIDLHSFLTTPLITSALFLAAAASIRTLKTICERHPELWPFRFTMISSIPAWVPPAELQANGLLPGIGPDNIELPWPSPSQSHIPSGSSTLFSDFLRNVYPPWQPSEDIANHDQPLSAERLSQWHIQHIDTLDNFGLLDIQLAWVQHGASLSVPSLDALGEDLSLLSRLIYDSHLSPAQQAQWNLKTWRSSNESEIVTAYLSNSTPLTIVNDIKSLILPYLYVLDSRAERSGHPDSKLVERQLHDAILSLSLPLVLPIFEASKATLSSQERLIKNDLTVARLALACLYGSQLKNSFTVMSAIFECLPVWDISNSDPDDKEATATTLESIATFVRPSKVGDAPPSAKDLYLFFKPLPFASLSAALDILDVHLESGEVLARWGVQVHLRDLLQSAGDKGEQRSLAERLVRRQMGKGLGMTEWEQVWADMKRLGPKDGNEGGGGLKGAFGLLKMEELVRVYLGGVLGSGKFDIARKIVRKLEQEHNLSSHILEETVLTVSREFYENAESGNLTTGNMKLAYDCLSVTPTTPKIQSQRSFIEATSKLCSFYPFPPLTILHSSDRLSFISQILSPPSTSPSTSLYVQNGLSTATQSNNSPYAHSGLSSFPHSSPKPQSSAVHHPEIILDLVDKLGYAGDVIARAQVLGMLTQAAIREKENDLAWEHCETLIDLTHRYPSSRSYDHSPSQNKSHDHRSVSPSRSPNSSETQSSKINSSLSPRAKSPRSSRHQTSKTSQTEKQMSSHDKRGRNESKRKQNGYDDIKEVCWKTCLELSKVSPMVEKRLVLLGRTLEFCPSEQIMEVLILWKEVEKSFLSTHKATMDQDDTSTRSTLKTSSDSRTRFGKGYTTSSQATTISKDEFRNEVEERGSRGRIKNVHTALDALKHLPTPFSSPTFVLPWNSPKPSLERDIMTRIGGDDMVRTGSGHSQTNSEGHNHSQTDSEGHNLEIGVGSKVGGRERIDEKEGMDDGDGIGLGMRLNHVFGEESDAERVQRHAKRALVKGVGWLLGADE
ncbi:hypothetical protein M231_03870 [Tremella mesenterica]|uniref:Sec39 domain-containing protein n=1 Tax=Tremella mesenterica TaxID=5217 RepID=A0A4Q1BLX8_TREME|nr:hypothetical protein M231_03870 [Tremella mesenterica]